MKGCNTLNWNQATMMAAVEYYLDQVVLKTPGSLKVTSIMSTNAGSNFEVKVAERKPEGSDAAE